MFKPGKRKANAQHFQVSMWQNELAKNAAFPFAANGLALGDVAKKSGLRSIGKIDFFREKNVPAS